MMNHRKPSLWIACHTIGISTFQPVSSCLFSRLKGGDHVSETMPDGSLCSPKRLLLLLLLLAAIQEAVGVIGFGSCLINIGSGASAPLPGTLGPTAWTPTSFLPRPMSSQAAGSVAPVGDTTKDSYIPVFSNRPQDYKEWRQRICLDKKKLDLQKKPKEATLNCSRRWQAFPGDRLSILWIRWLTRPMASSKF